MSRVSNPRKVQKNSFNFRTQHMQKNRSEVRNQFQGQKPLTQGRAKVSQRKAFTKASRTQPQDHFKVVRVQCAIPSPTLSGRKHLRRDLEIKGPTTRKNATSKRMRMKEIYVNPVRDKSDAARDIETVTDDDESKHTEIRKNSQVQLQVGDVISDAHKMIWFWLFNGLFPTTNVLGE